jgi:hypothetical protein
MKTLFSYLPSMPPKWKRGPLTDTPQNIADLRAQWSDPKEVLSILTIIGGDIVQCAIAQLTSTTSPRFFTPVAFSFGWVAYSFSAILAGIGSRKLAPEPDCACSLIDVATGYVRDVRSWILSRFVRDYEFPGNPSTAPKGLTVAIYHTSPNKRTSVPDRDWVYYSGAIVIALQLAIAIIPGALWGNWLILVFTFAGIVLVQIQSSLPQWRSELWSARPIPEGKHEVVCFTRGNGSPYVIVVRSDGCGLRLADLATGREVLDRRTVPATFILAFLWLVHLFCMTGVESNSWFSLLIGALGMLQNALASGARRHPSALGLHLDLVQTIHDLKVFKALQQVEEAESGVGVLLTDVYFPGGLRPEEELWKLEKMEKWRSEKGLPGGKKVEA